MTDSPPFAWITLGAVDPTALTDARLQLHWAAQVVQAVGFTHLPAAADDSHTNLGWSSGLGGLVGRPFSGASLRAGLRFADLSLLVTDDATVLGRCPLDGATLDDAYAWMADAVREHSLGAASGVLGRRDYEMPDHAVATGAAFATNPQALGELAAWYDNANAVLSAVQGMSPHASPVRCWPHHFDIATLIAVGPDVGAESARSIGVGMTPGDANYAEPYYYVTPWPYPDAPGLPALTHGRWHTEGWIGAVLTGSDVTVHDANAAQAMMLDAFLREAVAAAHRALQ